MKRFAPTVLLLALPLLVAHPSCDFLSEGLVGADCQVDDDCELALFCLPSEKRCVRPCDSDGECASGDCKAKKGDVEAFCALADAPDGSSAQSSNNSQGACQAYCDHVSGCMSSICSQSIDQIVGPCHPDCESKPDTWHQIPRILQMSCEEIRGGWCGQLDVVRRSCQCF